LKYLDTVFYDAITGSTREDCKKRDGHVPRNMRVALSLIDMAEPYVHIRGHERIEDDETVHVEWKAGGC